MDWAWVAQTVQGQALGDLTFARGRSVSFDLRGPCTAKFQIDGRAEQARDLEELQCDLVLWRGSERMLRARLGSPDDDLDADRHTTNFSAVDYRGVLGARIDEGGRTYAGWQQDNIGWDAVFNAQVGAGGALGITRGDSRAAPVVRTEVLDVDTPWDKFLDRFQDYEDGFEWWIDPELRFQQASWRGVSHPDFPLAWGTSISKLKRAGDTSRYANWVRVRGGRPEGAGSEAPEPYADRWAPNLGSLRQGRIARVVSNSDLKDQAAVNAAAEQLLADSLNPPAAYVATLLPGLWQGPSDVWLGDEVPLIVKSGRLEIDTTARVQQLDIELDEEGRETVTLTVGAGA